MTAAPLNRTPTESMRASAQAHLELKDDPKHRWQWYWQDGVRYVAVTSANSGKVHQVRADSQGCDCEAYLVWEYSACSHMLAVRESLNQDALAAWVTDQEREQFDAEIERVLGPSPKARASYDDLYGQDCRAAGCTDDAEDGESYCRRHQLVDAF